jgi:hypothetical protein
MDMDLAPWYRGQEVILGAAKGEWVACMISLQDQIKAILSAPIPFFFVLLGAVGTTVVIAWRMMEWLYKERMERAKDLFALANSETEIKTKKVDRLQYELNEKVESFTKEIESLSNEVESSKKEMLTPEILSSLTEKLSSLTKNVSSIESKVGELGKANNDVSNAVSRGTGLIGGGIVSWGN